MNSTGFQWIFCLVTLSLALIVAVGDDSRKELLRLEGELTSQRVHNSKLSHLVGELRTQVYSIAHDNRYLEQLSRNELALTRDNEGLVIFD